jgi:serine/threonine-protein kinase
MGVVYQAYDPQLRRMVAVKLLAEPAGPTRESTARGLLHEARSASRLNHSNICTIYEAGEADGDPYIAMEYVDGRTLREMIPPEGLPVESLLRTGIQIAKALSHAHEHQLIHRDLKASNVMITAEGTVKVLDFGLATRTPGMNGSGVTHSETGLANPLAGTLAYMAPETLRLESVDARSDIWSLGVLLHEMASGSLPFVGNSAMDVASAILREPSQPLASDVPVSLRGIIQRCLAKDPAQRYQRASEVCATLETVLVDWGGGVGRTVLPVRRTRWFPLIAVIVLVVGVLAAVTTMRGLRSRSSGQSVAPRIEALAVLPLENLSRDPDEEFFADGMTDALITRLSRIRALRVISRTSVMRYKNARKPLAEIAHDLKVTGIVQGTVLRSNGRVRIGVQLTDPGTERNLWANSYEGALGDALALQSEVARAIADEVKVAVTPDERSRLAASGRVEAEAYEAYLKGRAQVDNRTKKAFGSAIEHFRYATNIDPNFALAYAGLADAYALVGYLGFAAPVEAFSKSKIAATKALALEEELAEAHAALAMALFFNWEWMAAEPEFRRAIALNPNSPTANHWYSHYLTAMNRMAPSIAASRLALDLEPLNANIAAHLAWAYYYARRFDDAVAQCDRTIEFDPGYYQAYLFRGMTLIQQGKLGEAIRDLEKAASLPDVPGPPILGRLGYAYAAAGQMAGALRIRRELAALHTESAEAEAQVSLGLGQRNRALDLLDAAYRGHSGALLNINVEPVYDSLRSERRFQDLVRRMGLENRK